MSEIVNWTQLLQFIASTEDGVEDEAESSTSESSPVNTGPLQGIEMMDGDFEFEINTAESDSDDDVTYMLADTPVEEEETSAVPEKSAEKGEASDTTPASAERSKKKSKKWASKEHTNNSK